MSDKCKFLLALFLVFATLGIACAVSGTVLVGTGVLVGMSETGDSTTNPPAQPFDPAQPANPDGQSTTEPGSTNTQGMIAMWLLVLVGLVFLGFALLFLFLAMQLLSSYRSEGCTNLTPTIPGPIQAPI